MPHTDDFYCPGGRRPDVSGAGGVVLLLKALWEGPSVIFLWPWSSLHNFSLCLSLRCPLHSASLTFPFLLWDSLLLVEGVVHTLAPVHWRWPWPRLLSLLPCPTLPWVPGVTCEQEPGWLLIH